MSAHPDDTRRVLVYGATAAMVTETLRLLAHDGARLFLVGRQPAKLDAIAADLRVRGAIVDTRAADLDDTSRHDELYAEARDVLGHIDDVIVAHGVLGDQAACQRDFHAAEQVLRTNFSSVVSLLTPIANDLERRRAGSITVISSVAGDRGRQSNYVYGAAKGALSIFLQGLRNRLHPAGVRVLTIKPGFVRTPMTAHLRQGPLFADATTVGRRIHRAMQKNDGVVYLPSFWRLIMLVIRLIPEPVFKRLKL